VTAKSSSGFLEAGINSVHSLIVINLNKLTRSKGNLVLQDTIERIYAQNIFADVPRGIFLVRGENVLLLGEIVCILARNKYGRCLQSELSQDLDKEDDIPPGISQAPVEEVYAAQKKETEDRKHKDKISRVKLQAFGFEGEQGVETIL
jgi:U6 snRNA-associated Sm-like protein LSm1